MNAFDAARESIQLLHEIFADLTPEQRVELRDMLFGDKWCQLCGKPEPCYCAPNYDE